MLSTSLDASPRTPTTPPSGAAAAAYDSFGWEHFASMDQTARRLLQPLGARCVRFSPLCLDFGLPLAAPVL